jgi:hypothetical protein
MLSADTLPPYPRFNLRFGDTKATLNDHEGRIR